MNDEIMQLLWED